MGGQREILAEHSAVWARVWMALQETVACDVTGAREEYQDVPNITTMKFLSSYSEQALFGIPTSWVKHGFSGQNDKDAF